MREFRIWVYIMASKSRHIYTGMTNSITNRVLQHKSGEIDGFTKRYKINRLVYFEDTSALGTLFAAKNRLRAWILPNVSHSSKA